MAALHIWSNAVAPETLQLSVIVPTRNEVDNVGPLLAAFTEVASYVDLEVIFADDSDDGTPERVRTEGAEAPFGVTCVHRPRTLRSGGLGGAVVEGLRNARGQWACVIDGDLQHPPSTIPKMLETGFREGADVVIATRYRDGGRVGDFGFVRQLVSRVSSLATKLLFPRRLWRVSDPMSGFFAVRLGAIDLEQFHPQGFKILLELLVRSKVRVAEVGYSFGERHAGESHADLREGARFLGLLWNLRLASGRGVQLAAFLAVGFTGIFVNLAATALLTEVMNAQYLLSALLATQASTTWNFALSDLLVFAGSSGHRRMGRFTRFALLNNAAFVARGPLIFGITEGLGVNYLFATFVSLVALTLARYGASVLWVWRKDVP